MDSVITSAQNFAYAVKNPTTFIATGASSNWSTQDGSTSYMWNDKNVAKDTDAKSIFDPSPIGWRLPILGVWSDFPANATVISDNIGGYTPASATFYATGQRYLTTSKFDSVGSGSSQWSSTPYSTTRGYRLWISTTAQPTNNNTRTYGIPVRPVRE